MLRGRHSECDVFDRLLEAVRTGRSGALVVRGEAGIGKTALLEYAIESASDLRIMRAVGVESEMELPFAGLHQVCGPMLGRLDGLPDPQRDALQTAFGLSPGAVPDRFLVGLAMLSLLSDAVEERPLLCVVDDAQWFDRASAQALAFAARRLLAESVAMVFATREPSEELKGLPELVVPGLGFRAARGLLGSVVRGPLDERVRDRIVAETRGNPLALLELPRGLSPAQLAGGFWLPSELPVSGRIEESFQQRIEALPAESRRLLLLAAAEPVGDPALFRRAAERIGLSDDALEPAEAEGLLEFSAPVRFRHPLVRSAVYRAAPLEERQSVHRALAEVTDPELDPDRRAWHRAQAVADPDEDVAAELERSADRAQGRGGLAAAAAFLERAVGLTPDPASRARRALAAAVAKHLCGAPDVALQLLTTADAGPLDELGRARVDLLRAQVAYAQHRGSDAPPLLLRAAKRLEPLDVRLARATYLEALSAAQFAGRFAVDGDVMEVAHAALAAPQASEPPRASDLLLDGLATLIAKGYEPGAPMVKRALSAFRSGDLSEGEAQWVWLACRTAVDVWDYDNWELLSERMVALARRSGVLTALPLGLTLRMGAHLHAGELAAVSSLHDEVSAINDATGTHLAPYGALLLLAWRGSEDEGAALIETTLRDVALRGEGQGVAVAQSAGAVLYNGLGRYREALAAASLASEYRGDLVFRNWGLAELVEAAVRCGEEAAAADALESLSQTTRPSGTDWALGVEARCRALLSRGETAEHLYREAIERLGRTRVRVALARAHLVYGEWLRQEQRRLDAREQLRTAYEMCTRMGLEAFARRAERELQATGGRVRKRVVETQEDLTAQEARIARFARDGLSNPEIAARLFISPRTVEYHLHKVFSKLKISSRNELGRALQEEPTAALAV